MNNAPRSWYKRVYHELTNLNGIVSAYDNALFLRHDATGNLMGILSMYIDDFDGLRKRSTRVRTPVALLRSLSGKYPWERYEPPYPTSYGLNSTTTVLLGEWLWH